MLSKNQIKEIQSLQLKKYRDQKKRFVAEGVKTVLEVAATQPALVEEVIATEKFILSHGGELASKGIRFTAVDEDSLKKISQQSSPNGALAVCRYFDVSRPEVDFTNRSAFYLDDIRDPGNFGTIIRLCDWFGMNVLFCSQSSCDLYNPKVIQASMGAFLRVRVIYTDLPSLLRDARPGSVYGALLNGNNIYGERIENGLIVIGNEANGINESNLPFINRPIKIPAHTGNGTESLNAAMAASIIASEFFRQLQK